VPANTTSPLTFCPCDAAAQTRLPDSVLLRGVALTPQTPRELHRAASGIVALALANALAIVPSAAGPLDAYIVGKPLVDGILLWQDASNAGCSSAGARAAASKQVPPIDVSSLPNVSFHTLCGADLGMPHNHTVRALVLPPYLPAPHFRIRGTVIAPRAAVEAAFVCGSGAPPPVTRRMLRAVDKQHSSALDASSVTLQATLNRMLRGSGHRNAAAAFGRTLVMFWPESAVLAGALQPLPKEPAGLFPFDDQAAAPQHTDVAQPPRRSRGLKVPIASGCAALLFVVLVCCAICLRRQQAAQQHHKQLPLPSSPCDTDAACPKPRLASKITVFDNAVVLPAAMQPPGSPLSPLQLPCARSMQPPPRLSQRLLRALLCAQAAAIDDPGAQRSAFDDVKLALVRDQQVQECATGKCMVKLERANSAQTAALLGTHTSLRPPSSWTMPSPRSPRTAVFITRVVPTAAAASAQPEALEQSLCPIKEASSFLLADAPLLTRLVLGGDRGAHTHAAALLRSSASDLFQDDPFGLYWTAPLQPPVLFAFLALAGSSVSLHPDPSPSLSRACLTLCTARSSTM
jgi:hypothetical protein